MEDSSKAQGGRVSQINVFQENQDHDNDNGDDMKTRSPPRPPPLVVGNKCLRCEYNDVSIASESVVCVKCDSMFHYKCCDPSKIIANDAVCTPTFYSHYGPRNSKTGVNFQRYGNFYFCCEGCDILKDRRDDKRTTSVSVNTEEIQDCNIHQSSATKSLFAGDNSLFNKSDVMELLQEFKAGIIASVTDVVSDVVDKKLGPSFNGHTSDCMSKSPTYASVLASEPNVTCAGGNPLEASESCMPAILTQSTEKGPLNSVVIHASKKETLILDNPTNLDGLSEVPKVLTELLYDTPLLALNTKQLPLEKKVVLVFPSSTSRDKGKSLIENSDAMRKFGFMMKLHNKALPKVTISNIPLDVFDSIDPNLDTNSLRLEAKRVLHEVIPLKNSGLKSYIDQGHVFEVVYVNIGKMFATAGVKVSPLIRDFITSPNSSQIFISNSACPVKDRFVIRQCFNCQKLGHVSKACPESKTVVCMYCSGKHSTRNCNSKDNPQKHRCRNCSLSKDPRVSSSCHTHHASSYLCPIIQQAINRYRENTQRTSKN